MLAEDPIFILYKCLLSTGRIKYHYIDYVIVAPKTVKYDYSKKPIAALRDRYHDEPAKYKAMQNQFVGRAYRMYNNKHQAHVVLLVIEITIYNKHRNIMIQNSCDE